MRAVPAFQVTVSRLRWWRLLHASAAALTVAALCAWFVSRAEHSGWVAPVVATLVATAGWLFWAARQHRRLAMFTLRWDSQRWHLDSQAASGPGQLSVAVDVASWMLLRFIPESDRAPWRALPVWLALQRPGLEAQWHLLRCTVYGARQPGGTGRQEPMP